jgi:hypothetical protein
MNIGMKSILTLSQTLITSLSFMTSGLLLGAIDHSFFEMRIRPVLAEKCYECHSARSSKIKGGLRLDHIDFIQAGGDSGPALVGGKPEESLIIQAIRYDDPHFQMPPKEKLEKKVLADFEQWVSQGAPWPDEPAPPVSSSSKRSAFQMEKRIQEHWSWRPIAKSKVPDIKGQNLNEIDRFIRARLKTIGLLPAEEADKRTWLRRLSYDLTGLPPGVDEINQFLGDPSTDSYVKVVERLLDSVHFGEKWARHWMDLVRYAETCGHEFDYPLENPHEYRDYLIRAFNADVPYDQFLKEHVAGDLMDEPRRHPTEKFNESIIGTGFWYFHEAVHAPTDPKQDNADRMESQLDVFGKTFLGLTIGCARCHDHKFDAISEKDYYSLASFMQGSTRQEYPLDVGGRRKELAVEIEQLCGSAFDSLSTTLDGFHPKHLPSQYWKGALHLSTSDYKDNKADTNMAREVFADFEDGFSGWKASGKAFSKPMLKGSNEANSITGYTGVGWASSFNKDPKKSMGSLRSPKITVEHRFLNFSVGGGQVNEVGVELWADGRRVLVSRGENSDELVPKSWDLDDYHLRRLKLE